MGKLKGVIINVILLILLIILLFVEFKDLDSETNLLFKIIVGFIVNIFLGLLLFIIYVIPFVMTILTFINNRKILKIFSIIQLLSIIFIADLAIDYGTSYNAVLMIIIPIFLVILSVIQLFNYNVIKLKNRH